jgi:ribosomal-protein-alanine N-acetyltransferase
MDGETVFQTERLILRNWRPDDLAPFADMSADAKVMRYFPALHDRTQTEDHIRRIVKDLENNGFGLWAVEVPGHLDFAGFTGLSRPRFKAHFTPCVEIGWRLRREAWGKGYATEAARTCLDVAFGELGLDEVVSMTAVDNLRSRAVMERLGMTTRPEDDFGHPNISADHPLRQHVLYRLSKRSWRQSEGRARGRTPP